MKTCSGCRESRDPALFDRDKTKPDGLSNQCKPCRRAYDKKYRTENAERVRAARKKWKHATRDFRASQHGLTPERVVEMLAETDGLCNCCRLVNVRETYHVDHAHACCPGTFSCGKCVRGLLCPPCNRALGIAREDAVRLERMAEYIRRF